MVKWIHPSKRRIGEGQHCHRSTSRMHVRQLGAANLKNVRFLLNVTTVASPMLHEIVAVAGSPFVGSQALAAERHKPEVIGQRTWPGRIVGSTIQLPTQQDPQSVQRDEATLSVSKTRSCVPTPIKKNKKTPANWHSGLMDTTGTWPCFYSRGFREVLR